MHELTRRQLIRSGLGGAAVTLAGAVAGRRPAGAHVDHYSTPDPLTDSGLGIIVPAGFEVSLVARAGQPVGDTGYRWPRFPDGAATFAADDGGWYLVCNSEVRTPPGGGAASAIRFSPAGTIVDAYPVLEGTSVNCAGGPTPWGTWLSCEEHERGLVWECDPTGRRAAEARPAMGVFTHEAAAVDDERQHVYLTEDIDGGRLYRFVPDAYPDLSAGRLEALRLDDDFTMSWLPVPDPSAAQTPVRRQVPDAADFSGGEGAWYHDGALYFTTKTTDRVHGLDLRRNEYRLLWDGAAVGEPLTGVDNVTVHPPSGDLFVAEDGGNLELVWLDVGGGVGPFLRAVGPEHDGSEITGPCFSPDATRLYVSSQRAGGDGITVEVTGEFYVPQPPDRSFAEPAGPQPPGNGEDSNPWPIVGVGAATATAAIGAAVVWRDRRRSPEGPDADVSR